MSKLFQPLKIGHVELQHRVVMAPLTRLRADKDHVQLPMTIEYYTQRACTPGTLIISEACLISPRAGGAPHMPGIYTDVQIQSWKNIVDAVHAKGCLMFCQLVAPGRAADPAVIAAEGYSFASSSATPMEEGAAVPKELTEEEIWEFVTDFAQAARNAISAGFDGVEVHGANGRLNETMKIPATDESCKGYLVDQFIQDTCNKRTDKWGGSVPNRSRFAVEVVKAVVDAIGGSRTGLRLSPWSEFQGMLMKEPVPQFSDLITQLKPLELAHLHLIESRVNNWADVEKTQGIEFALEIWANQSPVLVAGGFKADSARNAVDEEYSAFDTAVVFGRYFVSTPDLVFRLKAGLQPNEYNRATFYTPESETGYLDYPYSDEFMAKQGP